MRASRLSHVILAFFLLSASGAWAQRSKPREAPNQGQDDDQGKNEKAESAKQEALEAARKWLEIFDSGQYGNAFQEMAPAFTQAIDSEMWETATRSIRVPLGRVIARKPGEMRYLETEPSETMAQLASGVRMFQEKKIQLPYREWVVLQCHARFQNYRGPVVECLQLVKDEDRQWKVIAISIQQGR